MGNFQQAGRGDSVTAPSRELRSDYDGPPTAESAGAES